MIESIQTITCGHRLVALVLSQRLALDHLENLVVGEGDRSLRV